MPKSPRPNLLNNALRRLREWPDGKCKVSHLAEEIGVSPAYLTKVETGHLNRPSREVFDRLVEYHEPDADVLSVLTALYDEVGDGAPLDDSTGSGVVVSDRVREAFDTRFMKGKGDGWSEHLLADAIPFTEYGVSSSLPPDLTPEYGRGERQVAVTMRAAVTQLIENPSMDWAQELQVLYARLLDTPDSVFLVEPLTFPYPASARISPAWELNSLPQNWARIREVFILRHVQHEKMLMVSGHSAALASFSEMWAKARALALPGEQAVAALELARRSVQDLRSGFRDLSGWTVKRKGGKVTATPPRV